ncbi:MAG: ABC transporter ATP-binding protein [Desulfitobacteriaceae bacterium]
MFVLNNVRYKGILDIKHLVLPEHKTSCIVGESGGGKTTLLRLLNNLATCDSGSILWHKQSLYEIDPIELRRRVVMLGQTPVVFDGSVRENLLIGLKFAEKALPGDDALREVLRQVSLKKELEVEAAHLSGGEKQRLALGRVLLMEPEVLLLDEPSSALDEDTEEILIESLVKYVKDKGRTLIMVTHARKIAEKYGEYIVEIEQGLVKSIVNSHASEVVDSRASSIGCC